MRRKKAKTLNLPAGLSEVATAYAEATGRSLSSLIEDLLRDELKENDALPAPTPEKVMQILEERANAKAAKRRKNPPVNSAEV